MANKSLIQSARRMYDSKYRPESKQWIADTFKSVADAAMMVMSHVKSTRDTNMSDLTKKQESTITSIENNDVASENFSNAFVELKNKYADFNKIATDPFKSRDVKKQASLEMQKIMKAMDNFQADARHVDAYKTATLKEPDVSEFATLGELADDAVIIGAKSVEDYQYMLPGNKNNLPTGIYVEQPKTGKLVRLSEFEPPIKVARKTISAETRIDERFVKDANKLTFDEINRKSLDEINRFQANLAEKASMYFDKRAGFGEGNDSFIEYHIKNTHAKNEGWNDMEQKDYIKKINEYKEQIKIAFKQDPSILDNAYKIYKEKYNRNNYNNAKLASRKNTRTITSVSEESDKVQVQLKGKGIQYIDRSRIENNKNAVAAKKSVLGLDGVIYMPEVDRSGKLIGYTSDIEGIRNFLPINTLKYNNILFGESKATTSKLP